MKMIPRTATASNGEIGDYEDHCRVAGTRNVIVTYRCRQTKFTFRVLIEDYYD